MSIISEVVEEKPLDKNRATQILATFPAKEKKILGTTAAFVQHKDPLTMVEAIFELSKIRNDFIFIHFGEGVLLPEVKKAIAVRQLENIYFIGGFLKNVEDLFSVFDVFIMSSEEEGLGSSVLDAFIYKVPVVSTNAGGLADVVAENGLLSNVKDAKTLAQNIDLILNDAVLREKLKSTAYENAMRKHALAVISKSYSDLFQKLIKS